MDPWHLTFMELRAMRVRMTSMDKLEKVTEELVQQFQGMTGRTKNMQTKISSNSDQINVLNNGVANIRKKVDKHRKDSDQALKELKELKKDITQVKEVGKGISTLRKNVQEQQKNNQHHVKEINDIREELTTMVGMRNELASLKKDLSEQQE